MSALRALPGFCWMVRNRFEAVLSSMLCGFLLRRPGPFIWISKPLKTCGYVDNVSLKIRHLYYVVLQFRCVFWKHFTGQWRCSHTSLCLHPYCLCWVSVCSRAFASHAFAETPKLITRKLGLRCDVIKGIYWKNTIILLLPVAIDINGTSQVSVTMVLFLLGNRLESEMHGPGKTGFVGRGV